MTPRVHARVRLRTAGRVVGTAAALGAMVLWAIFVFRNPYGPPAVGRLFTFGGLNMFCALVAAGAAARGAHVGMYLLFFVSFFPVGLNAMLGPGIFAGIGWLNLVYLAAAVLVHRGIGAAKSSD
jgi:hypothetical protein